MGFFHSPVLYAQGAAVSPHLGFRSRAWRSLREVEVIASLPLGALDPEGQSLLHGRAAQPFSRRHDSQFLLLPADTRPWLRRYATMNPSSVWLMCALLSVRGNLKSKSVRRFGLHAESALQV